MCRYHCAIDDKDSTIITGGVETMKVVARYNLQVGLGNIASCHVRSVQLNTLASVKIRFCPSLKWLTDQNKKNYIKNVNFIFVWPIS